MSETFELIVARIDQCLPLFVLRRGTLQVRPAPLQGVVLEVHLRPVAGDRTVHTPSEREQLEIDINRLKTLSKQDDPEALELLAEELTRRYATDKAALVRVHMAIGLAWGWVQGYPQSRAAYLRAEKLIEEIRVGYVVLELQRLVDLGECKMKLKDFQGARKLFDLAARFPIEEKPFWESDQSAAARRSAAPRRWRRAGFALPAGKSGDRNHRPSSDRESFRLPPHPKHIRRSAAVRCPPDRSLRRAH